jgi:hypothetical protein
MWMWPISTRVNKPENDDPFIVEKSDARLAEGQRLHAPDRWW